MKVSNEESSSGNFRRILLRKQSCAFRLAFAGIGLYLSYIYECSRGKKKSILDTIESEFLEDFVNNPPSSIPEAVSRIKKKDYDIEITDTPVKYWLGKKDFVI